MSKTSAALLMTLALSQPSLMAQDEGESAARPESSEASEGGSRNASAEARGLKKFGVGLGLGNFIFPVSGAEISFHYNVSSQFQVELGSWSGTFDADDLVDAVNTAYLEKFDVNGRLTQVRARYFPGNSFYVVGGLGKRTIDFDLAAVSGSARIAEKIKTESTVVSIGIGNIWSFDSGFFIGGEWIALAVPLASSRSTEIKSNTGTTADLQELEKDAQDAADQLGEMTTAGIAMLKLGWQF